MLPNFPVVRAVYLDEKTGILAGVKNLASKQSNGNKIIMECGTIETATILDVAKASRETASSLQSGRKLAFADAPVSGGFEGTKYWNQDGLELQASYRCDQYRWWTILEQT